MREGGSERSRNLGKGYMTVSAYNPKIRLLHIICSSSYIINRTTNQHCQTVLMGKHSFARLYLKSNNENAPKTLLFHSWGYTSCCWNNGSILCILEHSTIFYSFLQYS